MVDVVTQVDPRTEKSRREKMEKYGVDDLRTLRRVGDRRMTQAEKRKRKTMMDRLRVEAAIRMLRVMAQDFEAKGNDFYLKGALLTAADLEIVAGLHHVPVPEELKASYDARQERYSAVAMSEIME